jgi:hypothetical protein
LLKSFEPRYASEPQSLNVSFGCNYSENVEVKMKKLFKIFLVTFLFQFVQPLAVIKNESHDISKRGLYPPVLLYGYNAATGISREKFKFKDIFRN